jgi:transcriptional regulator with XRE-family HTH domain
MGHLNTKPVSRPQAENAKTVLDHDAQPKYRFGMNPIKRYRLARGLTQSELAVAAGTSQPQIKRLEGDERKLTKEWAERLAPHLRVPARALLFPPTGVPIKGYVSAGAAVQFAHEEDDLGTAPAPEDATADTAALIVRGDSMPGVAEDQWRIYYDERVESVPDDFIGQLCVAWLPDAGVYVKRIYRGRNGTFDLVSTGHETIRDVDVAWSAKVTWIKPR